MKIKIGTRKDEKWIEMDINSQEVDVFIEEYFTVLGIETDDGIFGIAQRDGGIEVLFNNRLVWSSNDGQCERS